MYDNNPNDEVMLTGTDIAKKLRISKSFVYKLIRNEEISCTRFGKLVRVTQADLQAYLDRKQNIARSW